MDPITTARDREIVELYWQRSERAIQLTHRCYGGLCTKVAMNILGNPSDAEECVNDTYLKAWKSIPPERPRALGAFLTRITRNLALDRFRAKRRQKRDGEFTVMLSELGDCIPAPEEAADELPALLNEFLAGLKETDRRLFVRRYWYAMMPAALAKREGMTVNAVTVKLYKTRNKLRKFLEERGYKL